MRPRDDDISFVPEPLTRRNAEGQVYQRPAVVDRQISEALGLGDEELRSRLEDRDEDSPSIFKEEVLVYLIRHFHRARNREFVNELAECLVRRCATWIDSKLRGLRTDLRGRWKLRRGRRGVRQNTGPRLRPRGLSSSPLLDGHPKNHGGRLSEANQTIR